MQAPAPWSALESVDAVSELLAQGRYVADETLSTVLFLAASMERPVLLEGEPGVGKTEAARVLAAQLGAPLIRLQCYEGIDASQALYEWDYARQLLFLRNAEAGGASLDDAAVFTERFLTERPLLKALRSPERAVLLIDEIDRADDEFEAFLLELLGDYQVTIPELGTVTARHRPLVLLTSNRTRELHDALKRRCLYHWIDYPSAERERQILKLRAPEVAEALADAVVDAVHKVRALELLKPPGLAETIDWARAMSVLGANRLLPGVAQATLGALIKDHDDFMKVTGQLPGYTGDD